MSVEPLASPRRLPLPMPAVAGIVIEKFGLPAPRLSDELCFTLKRRKAGTEIGLQKSGHWWSLSYITGVYPPGFAAARKWVASYGARYGYVPREVKQ